MSKGKPRFADPRAEDSIYRRRGPSVGIRDSSFISRRKSGASSRCIGRATDREKKRSSSPTEEEKGGDIFSDAAKLASRTYDALVHGGRSGAPPDVRRFVERHGDDVITSLAVCRKPIQSALKSVINSLSFGSLNKALKGKSYDDVFHLYVYLHLRAPSGEESVWRFEKNHVITIKRSRSDRGEECRSVKLHEKPLTAGQLWTNAVDLRGKRLFEYSADRDNCQAFVRDLLLASALHTSELIDFIMQDAQKLVPSYLRSPAKALTDLAAHADVALHGRGLFDASERKISHLRKMRAAK
jgi:hypothetical protein